MQEEKRIRLTLGKLPVKSASNVRPYTRWLFWNLSLHSNIRRTFKAWSWPDTCGFVLGTVPDGGDES